jgi:hypothetical protein
MHAAAVYYTLHEHTALRVVTACNFYIMYTHDILLSCCALHSVKRSAVVSKHFVLCPMLMFTLLTITTMYHYTVTRITTALMHTMR